MLARFLLTLTCLCTLSEIGFADNLPIEIQDACLQALPTVAEYTAAYLNIKILVPVPVKLIGASSPIATTIEPMITTKQVRNGQEIMGMATVAELEIPAGGTLELKPGGNHLMIMGLLSHPKEGERVKLTVRFAPGDQQFDLEIPVLRQEPK
jgi:copper(I)-binding protein